MSAWAVRAVKSLDLAAQLGMGRASSAHVSRAACPSAWSRLENSHGQADKRLPKRSVERLLIA